MDRDYFVQCICKGVEAYLRAFSLADNMLLHDDGEVEWISPKPDSAGPSLVYKISLEEKDAAGRIDELIAGIKAGTVPSMWFVSPNWKPVNIASLLLSKGFKDLSNPDEPEPAMALDLETIPEWPTPNPEISVKKVQSISDFKVWCNIVNEVLHGWPMVTAEHYHPWLGKDEISLYLACQNNVPIATAATILDKGAASLEFVATLKEYRNRGAATAACLKALQDLQRESVHVVTLRAFHDGISLYSKFGFKVYYTTNLLSYQNGQGA